MRAPAARHTVLGMRTHRLATGLAALAVAMGVAAGTEPAWGYDPTGFWRGSIRCNGQVLADRRSFGRDDVELLTQALG